MKAYKGEKSMTLGRFVQILANVPLDVQIDFTGFCEPFLNPDASQMMIYSITKGYRTVLYTTLQGFNVVDVFRLSGLQFREVFFHEYDGKNFDKQYFEIRKDVFRSVVKAQYWRESKIEGNLKLSRAGNVWDSTPQKGKFECGWASKDFSKNVVMPNGDVYLCCMDYGLKHKIGNLLETKYDDLDRQSIIDLSNQEESDIICRKCELFRS